MMNLLHIWMSSSGASSAFQAPSQTIHPPSRESAQSTSMLLYSFSKDQQPWAFDFPSVSRHFETDSRRKQKDGQLVQYVRYLGQH